MSIPITHSTRVQSPKSRVQSPGSSPDFILCRLWVCLCYQHCGHWGMSEVFYRAFCGYSQNTVLTLSLLPRHICMVNAAKGCLCANHVLPLCFFHRKHLSCSILCVRHDVLLAFVPAPANDVYTVQFFVSPAVVLHVFRPHVGFVFSVNYSVRIERNVLLIQTLPLPECR